MTWVRTSLLGPASFQLQDPLDPHKLLLRCTDVTRSRCATKTGVDITYGHDVTAAVNSCCDISFGSVIMFAIKYLLQPFGPSCTVFEPVTLQCPSMVSLAAPLHGVTWRTGPCHLRWHKQGLAFACKPAPIPGAPCALSQLVAFIHALGSSTIYMAPSYFACRCTTLRTVLPSHAGRSVWALPSNRAAATCGSPLARMYFLSESIKRRNI